jgi:hypothetical protein
MNENELDPYSMNFAMAVYLSMAVVQSSQPLATKLQAMREIMTTYHATLTTPQPTQLPTNQPTNHLIN